MSRAPQDRPDIQVFAEIAAIDQLATTRIERALPAGLTKAQFTVLDRLARRGGGETPAELARAFQLTKGALTNSLARLAGAGLIVVVGDKEDGRKKRATVTEAGAAAHREALAALRPITESTRQAFPENEFAEALPFLQSLRGWLEQNK
jgi:DNA-binding MarR family transcriptional regulator